MIVVKKSCIYNDSQGNQPEKSTTGIEYANKQGCETFGLFNPEEGGQETGLQWLRLNEKQFLSIDANGTIRSQEDGDRTAAGDKEKSRIILDYSSRKGSEEVVDQKRAKSKISLKEIMTAKPKD